MVRRADRRGGALRADQHHRPGDRVRRPDRGLAGRAGRRRPAARRPADRSRLMTQDTPAFPTSLGSSDADTITLLGQDLAADLMGKVGFGELALWLVILRRPTPSQVRVFEAVLVALADHGFTPSAIAAGLLGGGSRFLGVTEDAGRFLSEALADQPVPSDDAGFDALALDVVRRTRAAGRLVPGLGHPVHKVN